MSFTAIHTALWKALWFIRNSGAAGNKENAVG